jgi:hypothetical protein
MKVMVAQVVAKDKRDNDQTTQTIEVLDGKFDLFFRSQFGIKFIVRQETQHQHPKGTRDCPIQIEDDDIQESRGTSSEKVIKARSTWNTRRDPTSQKSGFDSPSLDLVLFFVSLSSIC